MSPLKTPQKCPRLTCVYNITNGGDGLCLDPQCYKGNSDAECHTTDHTRSPDSTKLSVEQLRSAWDNGPPRGCPSSPGHAPLFCFTCGTWTEYRWGPGGYQACQRCNSRDTIAL